MRIWRPAWMAMVVFAASIASTETSSAQSSTPLQHPLPHIRGDSSEPTPNVISQSVPLDRVLPLPLAFEPIDTGSSPQRRVAPAGYSEAIPSENRAQAHRGKLKLGRQRSNFKAADESEPKPKPKNRLSTVASALSLVLGIFFALIWISRRGTSRHKGPLPPEILQPLGRFRLSPKHETHIVRFGSKILALSVSSAGTKTLAELTDPEEVDRLTALCLGDNAEAHEAIQKAIHTYGQTHASIHP